jgi:hypothetical protein
MNDGPELAKLTTIFSDSTSSRQRRLTPKQRHTMLRSATTGLRRFQAVSFAQGAVVPDGVANGSDPTHRGRLGKGVGLPSAS